MEAEARTQIRIPEESEDGILRQIRQRSCYPQLRQLIIVLHVLGIVAGGIGAMILISKGIATMQDTSTEASGFPSVWLGVGFGILTAVWAVGFRAAASLIVDIADLLVMVAKRSGR